MELYRFEPQDAQLVLSWVEGFQENLFWSGRKSFPLNPDVFEMWHMDSDVYAYMAWADRQAVGYAELAYQPELAEVEIMRLLVAPQLRRRGLGHELVEALLAQVSPQLANTAYARIFPQNQPSAACFQKSGFVRVSADKEAEFNEWEANPFHWYSRSLS